MRNLIWEIYLKSFIGLLVGFRVFYWTEKIDRRKLNNRDLLIIAEAERRGFKVENLKYRTYHTRFYRARKTHQSYWFETMPLGKGFERYAHEDLANKWFVKKILQKANLPTPDGRVIKNSQDAQLFIDRYQYPVVIKPLSESRCQGVTVEIGNPTELERAIKYARVYGKRFLIEKFVTGPSYRVMVVNDRVVATCLRKPPQVVGDGKHSIRELVDEKNHDPRRRTAKNSTLHPVRIGPGVDPNYIPKKNEVIILNPKINLGSGADTVDLTDKAHPEITKISIDIAKLLDAKVLGLDLIVPNIEKARSTKNPYWIIEVNTLPFIDMHHFPFEGKPRDVAKAIWDMVLQDQK